MFSPIDFNPLPSVYCRAARTAAMQKANINFQCGRLSCSLCRYSPTLHFLVLSHLPRCRNANQITDCKFCGKLRPVRLARDFELVLCDVLPQFGKGRTPCVHCEVDAEPSRPTRAKRPKRLQPQVLPGAHLESRPYPPGLGVDLTIADPSILPSAADVLQKVRRSAHSYWAGC